MIPMQFEICRGREGQWIVTLGTTLLLRRIEPQHLVTAYQRPASPNSNRVQGSFGKIY
jgi:hypothetical protein